MYCALGGHAAHSGKQEVADVAGAQGVEAYGPSVEALGDEVAHERKVPGDGDLPQRTLLAQVPLIACQQRGRWRVVAGWLRSRDDSRGAELLQQQERRRAEAAAGATASPPRIDELVYTHLVELDDSQMLFRHPLRQAGEHPQFVSDGRDRMAEADEQRAELVQIDAEDAGPEPLRSGGDHEEVFEHLSPPCPATCQVEETEPGLSCAHQRLIEPCCVSNASTRDNPVVGIMAIIPRAG